MNDIIEMVTAKNKAINVIESCQNKEHVKGASAYLELFANKFDDLFTYTVLLQKLELKKTDLNIHDS